MNSLPNEVKEIIENTAWKMNYESVITDIKNIADKKMKQKYGMDKLGVLTEAGYRTIPINIIFNSADHIEIAYEIVSENFSEVSVWERVGYEKVTNLQNDFDEVLRLWHFYDTLIETEFGEFEINDASHLVISEDYEEMDEVGESFNRFITTYLRDLF